MRFKEFLNESKVKLGKATKTTFPVDDEVYDAIEYKLPSGWMVKAMENSELEKEAKKLLGEPVIELSDGVWGGEEDFSKNVKFKDMKMPHGYIMKDTTNIMVSSILVTPASTSKSKIEAFVNKVLKPIEMDKVKQSKGPGEGQGMGFWSDLRKGKM